MRLLAEAGLNAYRFGIEWARIEPRQGQISRAELAHYRRMIDTASGLGLEPVVTLHHFTSPHWFARQGGWLADNAIDHFERYVRTVIDPRGVEWVVTINEPNMMTMMIEMARSAEAGELPEWQSPTVEGAVQPLLPIPDPEVGRRFVEAHHAVRDLIREVTGAKVGWTVANQALTATPGNEAKLREIRYALEDLYLEAANGDDFIGVQAYSSQEVDENGLVPHAPHADNTLVGTAYRPTRSAWRFDTPGKSPAASPSWSPRTGSRPAMTTAASRTSAALDGLFASMADGVDVRGTCTGLHSTTTNGGTGNRHSG